MDIFRAELIGMMLLGKSKGQHSGWIVITIALELVVP